MRYSRICLALIVCLYSACATPISSPPSIDAPPIEIGWIGPLSGEFAAWGTEESNQALAYTNSTYPLRIYTEDGQCDPTKSNIAAHTLIHLRKVAAVIVLCQEGINAVAPMAKEQGIPIMGILHEEEEYTDSTAQMIVPNTHSALSYFMAAKTQAKEDSSAMATLLQTIIDEEQQQKQEEMPQAPTQ